MSIPPARRDPLSIPIVIILCCLFLAAAGCGEAPDNEAAIAAAIDSHLGTRTDLGAMQVDIAQIKFDGDEATAAVTISARRDPGAAMQTIYRLTRTGNGWEVQNPRGEEGAAESRPRSNGGDLPAGHPPVEGGSDSTGALPPGHPPVRESQPRADLPKGHPPVSN